MRRRREKSWRGSFRESEQPAKYITREETYGYLPLIHVPLKLLGDNEPASHSSREIPGAAGVPVPVKSGLPVRRIAAATTKPRTTTATKQPASNRRQFRCLFFVIRSWNNYRKTGGLNLVHSARNELYVSPRRWTTFCLGQGS